MKTLITLTLLVTLILIAAIALAAHPSTQNQKTVTTSIPDKVLVPRVTMLQPHPMLVEIAIIRKEMREREDELLHLLLSATTERECDLIIHRLERLDTDWDLALLKVQARYAHKEGRFDLEREIKQKINEVLVADNQWVQ